MIGRCTRWNRWIGGAGNAHPLPPHLFSIAAKRASISCKWKARPEGEAVSRLAM